MDPMTISASITGLLDITRVSLKAIDDLTREFRYAPADIASLTSSLQSLMGILDSVVHDNIRARTDSGYEASTLGRAVEDCSRTVAELRNILQDCRSSSLAKRRFKWTLNNQRIVTLLRQLERGKATIQLGLVASAGSRNDQFMDFVTVFSLEGQRERERIRIIDWLSTYDFEARHLDLQSLRLAGTFNWFRECDLYGEWRTGTLRLLWLEGRIGVGKSTLCSFVVDDLQDSQGAHHMLAYIYLNHRDHQARTKQDVLRIILRQLCLQMDDVHYSVRQLWDDFGQKGLAPAYGALLRSIHDILESSAEHHAFICLDGLDEVNRESQPSIIELLRDLNLEASVSTLVTSRSAPPADSLSSSRYSFAAHLSDTDKYINQQLRNSQRLKSKVLLQQKLFERLSPYAEGMFLAIALMTDEVLKQRSPKMMLKALETLPSRLCSVYMEILKKLGNGHQYDIAITLFALMLRAARSPTFQEIQVSLAIVQGEDGPDLEEALIDVEYILDCCTDLVVGDFETRTLSFSHPTVRLFLLGLVAAKQRIIPVLTLNNRFPGLFDSAPSMGNEDRRYHAVADTNDGESLYGSEGFSQFSRDETLVPSIKLGKPGNEVSMVPSRGTSVSEQLVKLFMADPALPGLVASALQRVGGTGFERTFSILLKQYSKRLETTASKPSQKVAAVWTGHATRRTSSLLRATVRPEDSEDNKLREAVLDLDTSKDLAVNEWLATQDAVLKPTWKGKIVSRSGITEPLAPLRLLNDERDDPSDGSDDEDLSATYTDLDAVKVFMTGGEPYMEMKSSLMRQTHYGDHAEDLITRRMVPENRVAVELQANTVTDERKAITVFTLITVLFLPLSFVASLFLPLNVDHGLILPLNVDHGLFIPFDSVTGVTDMGTRNRFIDLVILATLVCVTAYILIDLLNVGGRFGRWMDMFMQDFRKQTFASLCNVSDYKPKRAPDANKIPAFSPLASLNARSRLSRLWLGVLNWKGSFSNSLHVWKHGKRIDMTNFQWTCQCGRTFHETVRELVPGAAENWIRTVSSNQSESDHISLSPSSSSNVAPQATAAIGTIEASYTETDRAERGPQNPRNDTCSETEIKTTEADPALAEYIMLCIKQKQRRVRLFPDDIKDKRTDEETFISIKETYESEKASWWRLNTLSHIEFKKFQLYHSDYVDVSRNEKEEVPECAQKCESGCGNGCVEYWYSPPRVEQAPPIPRNAMVHFLESPSCLGTQRANRAALPKRREILKLGDVHAKDGWGLAFKEKVWSLPIVAVQILCIIAATVLTLIWCVKDEIRVGSFLPGVLVICVGQSIAALLQRWAESNLDEEPKA